MNYYWFNRQKIFQKAKEKYSKEKAAEYYKQNKESVIKTCHKKKKIRLKGIKEKYIKNCLNIYKKSKNKYFFLFLYFFFFSLV